MKYIKMFENFSKEEMFVLNEKLGIMGQIGKILTGKSDKGAVLHKLIDQLKDKLNMDFNKPVYTIENGGAVNRDTNFDLNNEKLDENLEVPMPKKLAQRDGLRIQTFKKSEITFDYNIEEPTYTRKDFNWDILEQKWVDDGTDTEKLTERDIDASKSTDEMDNEFVMMSLSEARSKLFKLNK